MRILALAIAFLLMGYAAWPRKAKVEQTSVPINETIAQRYLRLEAEWHKLNDAAREDGIAEACR